jgi:hypothetical protein
LRTNLTHNVCLDDYDDYEEENNDYAPPSRTGSALVDFIGSTLDPQSELVSTFISEVHDIFGPTVYTDKELLDILTENNANSDVAITALLEQKASREAAALKLAQAAPPPAPPGFSTAADKQKPPVSPVPKRAQPIGISLSGSVSVSKAGAKQSKAGGNPPRGGQSKIASSTPPLPFTPKTKGGGSRTSSPAITGSGSGSGTKNTPPLPLSRSSSKTGLATSSSSGQLNRISPLSDDEYEYEDISSAAVARLTIVVAGHVDAVSGLDTAMLEDKILFLYLSN